MTETVEEARTGIENWLLQSGPLEREAFMASGLLAAFEAAVRRDERERICMTCQRTDGTHKDGCATANFRALARARNAVDD